MAMKCENCKAPTGSGSINLCPRCLLAKMKYCANFLLMHGGITDAERSKIKKRLDKKAAALPPPLPDDEE